MKKIDYFKKSVAFDKKLLAFPVKECNESLVSLPDFFKKHKIPVIFNTDIDRQAKTPKLFFLRESVAQSLLEAAIELAKMQYILRIEDAYRNLLTQKIKFLDEVYQIRHEHPEIPLEKVKAEVNTYVAGIPILAAHTAGAAVDAVLVDKKTGELVDFGAAYHVLDQTAITNYPDISATGRKNRHFFAEIMEKHGMINYPFEYWHFSKGDVCGAYLTKEAEARFAPIIINRQGIITGYIAQRNMKTFF